MAFFRIAGDAELSPDGKSLLLCTDKQRLKQRYTIGLRTILGTSRYNTRIGVDWVRLLEKGDTQTIRAALTRFFFSFKETRSIKKLELVRDRQTRVLYVDWEVLTKTNLNIDGYSPILKLG